MAHIRIAISDVASEIAFESTDSPKDVKAAIEKALASGSTLSLTDTKGREYLVPAAKIGYVEIGEQSERRVGFGK
jgi:acetylornithine/succinyldiaminopimelate/putrescine aminotransferase